MDSGHATTITTTKTMNSNEKDESKAEFSVQNSHNEQKSKQRHE